MFLVEFDEGLQIRRGTMNLRLPTEANINYAPQTVKKK